MGGGPRTFPGGINKWQWKRLHQKKAMEKERKLLHQEKQLYQARIRSQIRANLSPPTTTPSHHLPISSNHHLKSLANRFIKDGAEDLWNQDDGPITITIKPPHFHSHHHTHADSAKHHPPPQNEFPTMNPRHYSSASFAFWNSTSQLVKFNRARYYSVRHGTRFRTKDSSGSDDEDSDYGLQHVVRTDGEVDMMLGGRASLGKYDVKITRRRLPQKEYDQLAFSMPVEMIRSELGMKKFMESKAHENDEEQPFYSKTRFDECGISPLTVKALSEAGYVQMTRVQETSVSVGLEGKDALVKAKTGTGKSAAFMLPAIEAVINAMDVKNKQRMPPIYVLILCPTRELASQIAAETKVMLKYHDAIGVQTLVGGTRFKLDQKRLETEPCQVRRVSQLVLNRDHVYIDMVGMGCVETHSKVKQLYLVAPHQQHFEMVLHLLKYHLSEVVDYKVIIFCTTAMMTSLMHLLLHEMKMNVREMHSRKPQLYRTRISDEFKERKRLILVTSDVSSRGMNYPDITLVIQVGVPPDREHYIHRLGRTGREGKTGEGILLLAPWEEYFINEIRDLPVEKSSLPPLDPDMNRKLEDSMAKIDPSVKESAYLAWLGYYNSIREISRDKTTLAELANQFSQSIGLQNAPALFRKTALRMGLKDIPGIQIRK
uniref:ATP-dependent RNA helicase n=1 Tax=Kalanchoe fedtschenkoi TaxID=63787 RepID=A0A7N0VFX1_KALFE